MDPYMKIFLQPFEHLKIRLEEITRATNNFDDEKCIGGGGFGKVYKGELSCMGEPTMVAIKRLDRRHGQGTPEFLKEITTLYNYYHDNLISLLGFCCEGHEMILVYELASRGSLDRHLKSSHLTWTQRIKICIDVAKGLSYLHDPREKHQRLIHCDVKSANILLDEQWNAKLSDFGLSIKGSANEQQSVVVTFASGTPGYCDPQYAWTHTLTKGSDVYSFGVVLFEVLCGTLCSTYSNGGGQQILVPTWIESYKRKKLNDIIFKSPTIQPLDQSALQKLSDIAYRCLKDSRDQRPNMAEVVTELETALEGQVLSESKLPFDYKEIIKASRFDLDNMSKDELRELLYKGVLLNDDYTWFSLNTRGEHCVMISCGECVLPTARESYPWSSGYNSRFAVGTYHSVIGRFRTRVKTQFLSPLITYKVNLVFKFMLPERMSKCKLISLKYKLLGERKYSTSYFAYEREDGWWMAELYRFTSDGRSIDLDILFDGSDRDFPVIEIEGIEFRPFEKEPISDSDANWKQKLPIDYKDIMKLSKNSVKSTTEKEVYSTFCRGFLINDGQEWFSLDKNGKKCYMQSARAPSIDGEICRRFLPNSRFKETVEVMNGFEFKIHITINPQLVSSQTTYGTYLVYKLPRDQSRYEAPIEVMDEELSEATWYIYLVTPQFPVIRTNAYQYTRNPSNKKGFPEHRDDGWMEVQVYEFKTDTTSDMIHFSLKLTFCASKPLRGLIIEGLEYRPV
ncbi:putative protein kinase RLK-Pelle-LRR-I-1 family [Helianthus anomalus]